MSSHIYDVIIVGAGAAGLSCAYELSQTKVDYLLLEAQSRIGGRVFSTPGLEINSSIEFGAEFIHSSTASTFSYMKT